MAFYYFLIFFILVESAIIFANGSSTKKNKKYLALVFIELFIISAFRSPNIGNDTNTYLQLFQIWGVEKNFFAISTRFEPGYLLLNRIVYFFNSNEQSILIVTSFIILYLFMRFIYKESEITWLSIYLFITLRYFYGTMNTIRSSIAVGIIFISYKYLRGKKILPFVFFVVLASMFHFTAIVFLIAYPIAQRKFNMRNVFVIGAIGIISFIAFDPLLEVILRFFPQYQHYLSSRFFEGQALANYLQFFINLFILLFGSLIVSRSRRYNKSLVNNANDEVKDKNYDVNIFLNIMLLGTFFSFIAIRASLLDRISSYFSVFSIVFIPKIMTMVKNKKERMIYVYLIIIFALIYHTIIFLYRPEWNRVFPYEFFWKE